MRAYDYGVAVGCVARAMGYLRHVEDLEEAIATAERIRMTGPVTGDDRAIVEQRGKMMALDLPHFIAARALWRRAAQLRSKMGMEERKPEKPKPEPTEWKRGPAPLFVWSPGTVCYYRDSRCRAMGGWTLARMDPSEQRGRVNITTGAGTFTAPISRAQRKARAIPWGVTPEEVRSLFVAHNGVALDLGAAVPRVAVSA